MLTLEKFSLGVGDRFAHQARAQLRACQLVLADGFEVVPVWNKSNREHSIVGSEPGSVKTAANAAEHAKEMGLAITLFQVAIALGAVCLIAKKKPLWIISSLLGALAAYQMVRVLYVLPL